MTVDANAEDPPGELDKHCPVCRHPLRGGVSHFPSHLLEILPRLALRLAFPLAELRRALANLSRLSQWGKSLRGLIIRMAPVKKKEDDDATEDAVE
jgi:hypothetical protein